MRVNIVKLFVCLFGIAAMLRVHGGEPAAVPQNLPAPAAAVPPPGTVPASRPVFTFSASIYGPVASDKALFEIFNRLGWSLNIEPQEANRALNDADAGHYDGYTNCIEGTEKDYPHLRKVPVAIDTISFTMYSANPEIKITNWKDLSAYRIGYEPGQQCLERTIPAGRNPAAVAAAEELCSLARSGRIDIAILVNYTSGYDQRPRHETADGLFVVGVSPAISIYPLLHERHAALIPQIEAMIKLLGTDGTLRKILSGRGGRRGQGTTRLLFIHSFHPGMESVREIIDAVQKEFADGRTVIYHEFLHAGDTPQTAAHWRQFFFYLRSRYALEDLDAVLTANLPALNFVKKYYDMLFAEMPVVFCNVGNLPSESIVRHPKFTGIRGTDFTAEIVRAALRNHPQTKRIFLINDYTSAGAANRKDFLRAIQSVPDVRSGQVQVEFSPEAAFPELIQIVQRLSPDTIGLCGHYYYDAAGKLFPPGNGIGQLCREAPVPFYGLNADYNLPQQLAGVIADNSAQGRMLAQIVKRVLAEGGAAAPAAYAKNQYRWAVNHSVMERFGLTAKQLNIGFRETLPDIGNVVIAGEPSGFFTRNPILSYLLLAAAAVIALLAGAVVFTFYKIIKLLQERESYRIKMEAECQKLRCRINSQNMKDSMSAAHQATLNSLAFNIEKMVSIYERADLMPPSAGAENIPYSAAAAAARGNGDFSNFSAYIEQMFAAVVEQIAWYKSIVDNSVTPTLVTDLEKRITYMNAAYAQKMQGSAEMFRGRCCICLDYDICGTRDCPIACLQENRPGHQFINSKDGHWYLMHASWLLNAAGKHTGYVVSVEDNNNIMSTQELLQSLIDISPAAIQIFPEEGLNIIECNQTALTFFGVDDKQYFKQHYSEFLPPCQPDGQLTQEVLQRQIAISRQNGGGSFELMFCTASGEDLPLQVTHRFITLKTSRLRVTFLSDRRQEIVRRKQLQEAVAAADKANAAKSDFLARMSHEIRTPMTAVMGLTHLMLQTPLSDIQHNYLTHIDEASRNMLHLINDILDLSKAEAGKLTLSISPFSLRALLQGVVAIVTPLLHDKKLMVVQKIDANLPENLLGDANKIRQVLLNICGNAAKFTECGQIEIKVMALPLAVDEKKQHIIDLFHDEKARPYTLHFSISDSGCGIDPQNFDKIFEPFEQEEGNQRYNVAASSGLGLAICKSFVEMHGGNIWVKSELGTGTTFHFTLIVAVNPAPPKIIADETVSAVLPVDWSDWSVLVAEDNSLNRLVVREMLMHCGIKADFVENGQEAIETVSRKKYDLILMDVQMPGVDGYAATHEIRRRGNTMPIIALTAHAMPEDRERSLEAGMNDHLVKPLLEEQLREALFHWADTVNAVHNA